MTPKIGYAYICKWQNVNDYYINIITKVNLDGRVDLHCISPYESTSDGMNIHAFNDPSNEITCLGKLTKEEIISKYPEYFI